MNNNFFSSDRRKDIARAAAAKAESPAEGTQDYRKEFERDYDRILFSTPVRRMADKTQVFPLEKNDSVRTRLTHSHEVATLARALGHAVTELALFDQTIDHNRIIPPILAAVGLAHDLGNPPFGHSGEAAIQTWFKKNKDILEKLGLSEAQKNDFLKFEGNAQTFRLVTKLQILSDDFGLDLTVATLAALVKYPVGSDGVSKKKIHKKHGFFQSEADIVSEVWSILGLKAGQRHPLAFLMEACDDIAYLVLDAEDAVKKGLASFNDLITYLRHSNKNQDSVIAVLIDKACGKHQRYSEMGLSPRELNDVSMQRFRAYAIGLFVDSVQRAFKENFEQIIKGDFTEPILDVSTAKPLADALRSFDTTHAYRATQVLELENQGFTIINELMDMFWIGITDRKDNDDPSSKRVHPFSILAYSLISENYRRVYESKNNKEPLLYRDCQLLTDMISGMSDQYAVDLHRKLKGHFNAAEFNRKSSIKN